MLRYISVLVDLTHLTGASVPNAVAITHQLTDVSIRVPAVRRYAVKAMSDVLLAGRLLGVGGGSNAMSEVLHAAAFIVGEYSEYVEEHLEVIRVMVRREVSSLSGETQVVFVQAVMKVLASGLYQPFDVSGEDQDVSLDVKVKDLLGRREVEDEEEKEEEGDEVKEESERAAERAKAQAEKATPNDDADPEQEEEELDANGVKKRKVKARKRSYHDHCRFVGEMLECLYRHLPLLTRSPYVEVQERAVVLHEFVGWLAEQAQMQPFISVPVERRTRKPDAKDNPAATQAKDAPPAAAVTDLLADSSTVSSPRHLNGSLPPSSLLSSLAVQVNLLFSERLNPVNPKAQRKVPLPKGLDLDAVINQGWDVDSDRSEEEASQSEEEGEEGGKRRKKKDRKREKEKRKKDKKERSVNLYGEEEEDYSKPLTEQEKAEAKRRLDARRAAQMADPFYVKDKAPSTTSSLLSSSSSAPDAGLQRLSRDDLPPIQVETERERRKKKHRRRGKGSDDDEGDEVDDIFAGVASQGKGKGKVFTVKKTDDMPSGAESSDDGDEERDDDLTSPLREDEVIPKVKPYGSEDQQGEEKKKKRRKEKDKRDDGDRRDRKQKKQDRDRDRDRDGERGRGKEKEKEKDKEKEKERTKATVSRGQESKEAVALDWFDPMASSSRSDSKAKDGEGEEEEEREERRKKKRDTEKQREKNNGRDRGKDKEKKDKSERESEREKKDKKRRA